LRCPMGIEMEGGYLERPGMNRGLVRDVVKAAIEVGIYVIIDWHTSDGEKHVEKAVAFFSDMARAYGEHPNVLFETYNEPPIWHLWPTVKKYHEQIIPVIRKHTDNIIICGTPMYCQHVDVASTMPINATNIAYALHFYAATHEHKAMLRKRARTALGRGIALAVTEWGTCDKSGNGSLDYDSSRQWLDFLEENNIWDCNWAISDKYESCSALEAGASVSGNWARDYLTWSGSFVRASLRGEEAGLTCSEPGWPCVKTCANRSSSCMAEECCSAADQACHIKDENWAQCMEECTPGIQDGDPVPIPWSCELLGPPVPEPAPIPWLDWPALAVGMVACLVVASCVGMKMVLCKSKGQLHSGSESGSDSASELDE